MAFNTRRTYLCYNNGDLIRDGYIPTIIEKEYIPVETFNDSRLVNPPKGITYIVGRDENGDIDSVIERKKQLPASKIKLEIDFSKVMKNAVTHPFSPGSLAFIPLAGIVAPGLLSPIGFGGITSGLTYITFHLLDSEVRVNYKIIVDRTILDTGIIQFEGEYPLSVFGIVKDHILTPEEDFDRRGEKVGLIFSDDDLEILGKYSDGIWRGTARKRISGATDSDGLFGGQGDAEIKFKDVKYVDQNQLFIKIVKDERTLKFRGDNYDADGGKAYPFKISGVNRIDATDRQIRIDVTDLNEGDYIYITYTVATDRHVRQNLSHRGDIGQGNTIGVAGFIGAIKSEVDAWDYQLKTWKVPLSNISMHKIDELSYTSDDDYKTTLSNFLELKEKEEKEEDISDLIDEIEGWRLSESITNGHVKMFWAADYRGILLYSESGGVDFEEIINNIRVPYVPAVSSKINVALVYPASEIRDQDWFNDYLKSLSFTTPTGSDGTYLPDDLRKKIEDYIDIEREPGFLFDVSEITNSMLFDREKIPYYRPFAEALKTVRNYDEDSSDSGVGIVNLDILEVAAEEGITDIDLTFYDLSYIDFVSSNAQPVKSYSCEEPFEIHAHHYFSENYDAKNEGPGAWLDQGHIDNEVFEWRPSGSSIESYWKVETPYFCGKFTRKSRVFIEKMAGNSLDNYSWIYVDTEPFSPNNISLDTSQILGRASIAFNDGNMHYGVCCHHLKNSYFEGQLGVLKSDPTKSHVMEDYNHDDDIIVGQNRILGDIISFAYGYPIADDVTRICREKLEDEFWFTADFLNGTNVGSSFYNHGLDFADDVPKVTIPSDWYVKELIVQFVYSGPILDLEKYVSFYFEGTKSSISNIIISNQGDGDNITTIKIPFSYYYGGPIQFLGRFWKNAIIHEVKAVVNSASVSTNPQRLDINDYKIRSGQSAIIYENFGRLLVFYANEGTGNIDIALSLNDGERWTIHKNIIRLIGGEYATLPFVIKDPYSNLIYLFYVLNDSFLMFKMVNPNFLNHEDAFVEHLIPDSYDVGDYDEDVENPERAYWGSYSAEGLLLRRSPSWFVSGSGADIYFTEQLLIRDNLNLANSSISDRNKWQLPRWEFSGNISNMRDSFKGDPYAVYMNNEGVLRLFILSDGKLSIKSSNNYFSWSYDVFEQEIHKIYVDDKLNKGLSQDIQNIQIVRNDYDASIVSVLYFNNRMLFIRHFMSSLLLPQYDSNGNKNDEQIKKHLGLGPNTGHRPVFLVGNIPNSIKDIINQEKDDGIKEKDSKLYLQFPYSKDEIGRFDERFDVDVDTQPYGYVTVSGLMRIFYRDSLGNLDGIIIDSLKKPTLEVKNRFSK